MTFLFKTFSAQTKYKYIVLTDNEPGGFTLKIHPVVDKQKCVGVLPHA